MERETGIERSVTRLGASILKTIDAGDGERGAALLAKMTRIAKDPTSDGCLSAFKWLDSFTDGTLGEALRKRVWREPQILIELVKTLRRIATNPRTSAVDRNWANAWLKKHGFDDESLRMEDVD